MEEEEAPQSAQRAPRVGVMMSAVLTAACGKNTPVRVRNFSETGLSVRCDWPLSIGETVQIELRDMRISAEVVRCDGELYGLRVDSRIDANKLAKKPAGHNAFVVSNLHKPSETMYRPSVKRRD